MQQVTVLTLDPKGEPTLSKSPYDGPVPNDAFAYAAHRVRHLAQKGFCSPEEAQGLFATVCLELETSMPLLAARTTSNRQLKHYLRGAVRNVIWYQIRKEVIRRRTEYRQATDAVFAADARAALQAAAETPEGADVGFAASASATEGYTAELGPRSLLSRPLTVQQMAEALPDQHEPDISRRRAQARATLKELLPLLPRKAARAFLGYIRARGDFPQAANFAHIGKNRFYALWPRWIAQARAIARH